MTLRAAKTRSFARQYRRFQKERQDAIFRAEQMRENMLNVKMRALGEDVTYEELMQEVREQNEEAKRNDG